MAWWGLTLMGNNQGWPGRKRKSVGEPQKARESNGDSMSRRKILGCLPAPLHLYHLQATAKLPSMKDAP